MKCHEAATLQLFADDELGTTQRDRFAVHLGGCALCTTELEAITGLRARLRGELSYHPLPPRLRERLLESVAAHARRAQPASPRSGTAAGSRHRPRAFWVGLGSGVALGGAFVLAATLVVLTGGAWWSHRGLIDEVVAAHGRSSLSGHIVDIDSSDRHTVRPWLSQRLDYSPPVADLKDEGFPLVGGRLDRIDGASVATLVYRYGQHRIDVYVRPASGQGRPVAPATLRGYNIVEAYGLGMQWIGVSDVNATQLQWLIGRLADPRDIRDPVEPAAQ